MAKVMGTVKSIIGEATATAPDGTVRKLQVGDQVFTDDVISTSATGSVQIALAGGQTLECGNDTSIAMNDYVIGSGVNVALAATPVTPPAATDVASLQAAIAAGADPSQVAEATAAGGAPGAGGGPDGGGGRSIVVLEQGNASQVVQAGFNTQGAGIAFPEPEVNLLPEIEQPAPTVSVGVGVGVDIGNGGGGDGGGIIVIPPGTVVPVLGVDAIDVPEMSTNDWNPVSFLITLNEPAAQDITITFIIQPIDSDGADYRGPIEGTVTIPAGSPGLIITQEIFADLLPESDQSFQIILTDVQGATLLNDTATVTIVDDDVTLNAVGAAGDESDGLQTLNGTLTADFGTGDAGTLALSAEGATWTAGTKTLAANDGSWTLVLGNAVETEPGSGVFNYSYTFTQNSPFDHQQDGSTAQDHDDPFDIAITAVATDTHSVNGVSFTTSAEANFTITIDDDGPVARDDDDGEGGPIIVGENIAVEIDAFANDDPGTDGVDFDNDPAVAVTFTQASLGTVSYDPETGLFTYTPQADAQGEDSFTYTIKDGDGDTSTATVSLFLQPDSVPQIRSVTNLAVDEDGFVAANADDGRAGETDSTESLSQSGTAVVNFGADVPVDDLLGSIKLLDTGALDGQLQTLAGDDVVFALEGGKLVGRPEGGGDPVITIEITNAVTGPGANEVTYTYKATLSQPVQHPEGAGENTDSLLNVRFEVTDSDGSTKQGSFKVDVVDDIPVIDVAAQNEAGVVLTTRDANTIGENSDTASSTADFSGVFAIPTQSFGADGAGTAPSLSYALTLAVAEGSASNLTSGGAAINLFEIGGVIYGSTANVEGDAIANAVFSISVDGDGVVTLTQYAAIDHTNTDPSPTETPFADHAIALGNNLVKLTASATITDADGDSASDSATIDLGGGNIRFLDHGPQVNVVAADEVEIVLTTQDADTIGDASDTDSSEADFSGVFTIGSQSFGADGAGTAPSLSYALSLAVDEGDPSNLTSGGAAINLFEIGGVIYGSTAAAEAEAIANAVFSISVDGDGIVTLTQFGPIDHTNTDPSPTEADFDDHSIALANNLVQLTASATISDSDNDTAGDSETIDLGGGNIRFLDDGPSVSIAGTTEIVEGTTYIDGTWTKDEGADVGGAVKVMVGDDEYDLDEEITIAGKGVLIVKSDMTWEFQAAGNLDNPNGVNVSFDVTITDFDGDTDTDTHTITITDGAGPEGGGDVTLLPLNEDDLPAGTDTEKDDLFSSDELDFTAGSDNIVSFAFGSTDDIEIDGLGDVEIEWVPSDDGLTLIGKIDGVDVIKLELDGTLPIEAGEEGSVTVKATLLAEFPHGSDPEDKDSLTISGIVVVAEDTDGNQATGIATVTVVDDEPTIDAPDAVMVSEGGVELVAPIDAAYGADGGTLSLTGFSEGPGGVIQGTYVNGEGETVTVNLTYNNKTLTYDVVDDSTWVATNEDGVPVYTISLDSVTKTYTVTMHEELDAVLDIANFRSEDIVSGGIGLALVFEDDPTGVSMRVTADTAAQGFEDKVNTNAEWIGSGSQAIDLDEALILEFATNGSWSTVDDSSYGQPTAEYEAVSVRKVSFAARALSSSETMEWVVYDAAGNVITEPVTWTVLRYEDFAVVDGVAMGTGDFETLTFTARDGTVTIDGESFSGWQVTGEGSGGSNEGYYVLQSSVEFSKIVIEAGPTTAPSGTAFDIGYIDIEVVKGSFDITTSFDITVTDGDLDTNSDTVNLTFSSDGTLSATSSSVVQGSAGEDDLTGSTANDILIGGAGDDLLAGDTGDDTFKWVDGDEGTTVAPATDTITDWLTGNNKLDLSDVLSGENSGNLDTYLRFEETGDDVTVFVSTTGNVAASHDQVIVLQGVSLTDLAGPNAPSNAGVIDNLLEQSKLIVG